MYAVAGPAPVSGGIVGCDASGRGEPQCAGTYTEADTVILLLIPGDDWNIGSAGGCEGVLDGNTYTTAPMLAGCTVAVTFTPSSDGIFEDRFQME